jgi:hypothetical protein
MPIATTSSPPAATRPVALEGVQRRLVADDTQLNPEQQALLAQLNASFEAEEAAAQQAAAAAVALPPTRFETAKKIGGAGLTAPIAFARTGQRAGAAVGSFAAQASSALSTVALRQQGWSDDDIEQLKGAVRSTLETVAGLTGGAMGAAIGATLGAIVLMGFPLHTEAAYRRAARAHEARLENPTAAPAPPTTASERAGLSFSITGLPTGPVTFSLGV